MVGCRRRTAGSRPHLTDPRLTDRDHHNSVIANREVEPIDSIVHGYRKIHTVPCNDPSDEARVLNEGDRIGLQQLFRTDLSSNDLHRLRMWIFLRISSETYPTAQSKITIPPDVSPTCRT